MDLLTDFDSLGRSQLVAVATKCFDFLDKFPIHKGVTLQQGPVCFERKTKSQLVK